MTMCVSYVISAPFQLEEKEDVTKLEFALNCPQPRPNPINDYSGNYFRVEGVSSL